MVTSRPRPRRRLRRRRRGRRRRLVPVFMAVGVMEDVPRASRPCRVMAKMAMPQAMSHDAAHAPSC